MLYIWIDKSSCSAISRHRQSEKYCIEFIDSGNRLQWLSRFRVRRGLQKMLLHGEGAEVNKSDPGLLVALDDLYAIIA